MRTPERQRLAVARYRAKLRSEGRCVRCGGPNERDTGACSACSAGRRESQGGLLREQYEFEKAQRLAWEARICKVQRGNPELPREALAERFGTTVNVITNLARKYGLKLLATEAITSV